MRQGFTIVWKNTGKAKARNVVICDVLPNHLTFVSAPGSSSLITAAAVSAEIKSQAIMQKMMAAMLRQEAGRVAHDNAIRKRTATFAGQLQNNMTNVLQHK